MWKCIFYKGCENIKNILKKRIKIIITLSIALIIFFSGFCLAKYEISKTFNASSKVANPVLEVKGTEEAKISAINNIGYYDFIVKNYNEKGISEIPQNYNIEIISNTDESIEFELYRENEKINLINNKTEDFLIENLEKKEHTYRLKVSYNKEKSNSPNDILEDVQIKIHSVQKKI